MDGSVPPLPTPAEPDDPPFVTLLLPDQRAIARLIGPQGATAADLLQATGWPAIRVETALRGLRAARAIVLDGKRWKRPPPPPRDDPPQTEAQAAAYAAKRREREEKYAQAIEARDRGDSFQTIARDFGLSVQYAEQLVTRARTYFRTRGLPARTVANRAEYDARKRAAAVQRYAEALELRKRGASYRDLSQRFGLKCDKKARQLVLRARRWDAEGRP